MLGIWKRKSFLNYYNLCIWSGLVQLMTMTKKFKKAFKHCSITYDKPEERLRCLDLCCLKTTWIHLQSLSHNYIAMNMNWIWIFFILTHSQKGLDTIYCVTKNYVMWIPELKKKFKTLIVFSLYKMYIIAKI